MLRNYYDFTLSLVAKDAIDKLNINEDINPQELFHDHLGDKWQEFLNLYKPAQDLFDVLERSSQQDTQEYVMERLKDQYSRMHDRPSGIITGAALALHLNDQNPQMRQQITQMILGGYGPKSIDDVLIAAGLDDDAQLESVIQDVCDNSVPNADQNNEMALVIDIQDLSRMDRQDAQNYVDALAQKLEQLRANHVAVTWVTMRENPQFYPPIEKQPGEAIETRDLAELIDMGFYGVDPAYDNYDILKNFLVSHGPQTDEAVFCKSVKSALLEKDDAHNKPEYIEELERQCGQDLETYFSEQDYTLSQYMRDQGVTDTYIMGAVSSHCVVETAVSAAIKGFNPFVLVENILSWLGPEDDVDPTSSFLVWQAAQAQAQEAGAQHGNVDNYHQKKFDQARQDILSDSKRGFTMEQQNAIENIGLGKNAPFKQPETQSSYALSNARI